MSKKNKQPKPPRAPEGTSLTRPGNSSAAPRAGENRGGPAPQGAL